MIKIIKHGQTEFSCTCARCGCEFTYELEDMQLTPTLTSALNRTVTCPDCGECCYIDNKQSQPIPPQIGWPTPGEPIPCNVEPVNINKCAGCSWYENMLIRDSFAYVGDTPCTWCSKNNFYGTDTSITVVGTTGNRSVNADLTLLATDSSGEVAITVGEFSTDSTAILDVDVTSFEGDTTKTAEMSVTADSDKTLSCDNNTSDTVLLSSLPEPDLSSKDIITADVPTSSDSYINDAIATAKKKRSYNKKSTK